MSVLSSWGSVEAGKAVDGADGAMDTGIQAYRYRLSVEHLVGEAMRSSGTPNWKSRAVSWLGAEVGEEVGEAKAAILQPADAIGEGDPARGRGRLLRRVVGGDGRFRERAVDVGELGDEDEAVDAGSDGCGVLVGHHDVRGGAVRRRVVVRERPSGGLGFRSGGRGEGAEGSEDGVVAGAGGGVDLTPAAVGVGDEGWRGGLKGHVARLQIRRHLRHHDEDLVQHLLASCLLCGIHGRI